MLEILEKNSLFTEAQRKIAFWNLYMVASEYNVIFSRWVLHTRSLTYVHDTLVLDSIVMALLLAHTRIGQQHKHNLSSMSASTVRQIQAQVLQTC